MTIERLSFAGQTHTEGRRLKGSVQLAGARTFRNNEWVEIDPAALVRADASDVFARIDHDPARTVARTKNGTLSILRTDQGISYETSDLPNTLAANDALEMAKGDYFGGSSFEIEGPFRYAFSTDADGTRVRRFTSIKRLVDVSPVLDPAFESTASAFSKETKVTTETEIEDEKALTPEPEAKPKFSRAPDEKPVMSEVVDNDVFGASKRYAEKMETPKIEEALNAFWAEAGDNPTEIQLERIRAFGNVLETRRNAEAVAKQKRDQLRFERDMMLGKLPKAPEAGLYASEDYKAAFDRYLRTGDKIIMEQFAQSIAGDGTEGGYMVPDGFLPRITERLKAYGGVNRLAEEITTATGQPLPWPTNDDTGNSAVIATEGSAAGSGGADLVLGQVMLGAYSYDATGASNLPLAVSKELLQDAAFDVQAFVSRKLGERLGRKMAADFATANGSAKPKGLFDKSADVMTATTLYAAFSEHLLQVDQAYRETGNCGWMFSDSILAKVLASVDGNGRPLFTPAGEAGGQAGFAGYVLGYPVTLDQGAGSAVAFGDVNLGYIIRRVRGVTIDVDPYTLISKRQIAFHAWARADGQIQDSYAVSVSSYSGVSADSAS